MNIFNPERLEGETRADYKARRTAGKAAARAITQPANYERFSQHINPVRSMERGHLRDRKRLRATLGQQPKLTEPRARKHPAPIKPTWPKTSDFFGGLSNQQQQSRPVIVQHPLYHLRKASEDGLTPAQRAAHKGVPKHELDAEVALLGA